MRGKPVKELSVGQMLDGLFAITRDFDMQTQPHLLLLQKTMVRVEGVATALDPDINMWETSGPFVSEWIRSELGPEAQLADRLIEHSRTLRRLPDLVRRLEQQFPPVGGAPPPPPLPDVQLVWERRSRTSGWWRFALAALVGAAAGAGLLTLLH
jgi:ubiquinone biosynthesis protein